MLDVTHVFLTVNSLVYGTCVIAFAYAAYLLYLNSLTKVEAFAPAIPLASARPVQTYEFKGPVELGGAELGGKPTESTPLAAHASQFRERTEKLVEIYNAIQVGAIHTYTLHTYIFDYLHFHYHFNNYVYTGFKIPIIENLGVLQDQVDVIDLSDNEIRKLDNFPTMKRLSTLLVNNNYVSRIGRLGETLATLTALILTNNRISKLSDVGNLATLSKLEHLSLLENPVTHLPCYRLFTIHMIPSLKSLDYAKVTQTERQEANTFFESDEGKALLESSAQDGGDGEGGMGSGSAKAAAVVLTEEQKVAVKAAIESATTRADVDRIEKELKAGTFDFGAAGNVHSRKENSS